MVTRRRFLGIVGAVGALAGCSAQQETSRPGTVCEVGILADSGETVFSLTPTVRSFGTGEEPLAELVVPIRQETIAAENVDELAVRSGEEIRHRIPVTQNDKPLGETNRYDFDDVVEYSQSLGHVPQAGIYRIAALDAEGEDIEQVGIEFRCYFDPDEGES